MIQLDSDLLRTFVAIADTGNFTRAADHLGRTQSAISMQMKRLEATVGDPLFDRGSRGVVLTRKGDHLLTYARRVVALLDETAASLDAPPLDGPVRIGIPEEYGNSILSRALGAFAKRHPQVEITVRYAPSSVQMAAIADDELDLAVVFEWQDFSKGEVLMTDPTVWVTSELHQLHEERPLPVALYNNSGWCRDFAIKSLQERGIAYRVAYKSETSGGLKLAVTSGFAVAPISRSNIPAGCRELTASDGFGAIDSSNVVLHRNRAAKGATVDGMAEAIREAFRTRPE
ncbi:LysR substrate-binding domain-containing protein [Rhizobiaceae sp. 2RAB30]